MSTTPRKLVEWDDRRGAIATPSNTQDPELYYGTDSGGGVGWHPLPGGGGGSGPDLSDATPTSLGTAAPGTSPDASRADHAHAHGNLAGGTLHATATSGAAGFMAAADKAKLDGIDAGANATVLSSSAPADVGATASAGASSEAARGDHQHAHGNQLGGALHAVASDAAAGFMSAAEHTKLAGIQAGANATTLSDTPALVVGMVAGAGTSGEASRADHQHNHGDQLGGTLHALADNTTAGFMSSAEHTKLAGVAAGATATPLSSSTPAAIGTAAAGSGTSASRDDHVHAHGNQAGGSLHSVATSGAAGFMAAADKSKLDGIDAGATATPLSNSTPTTVASSGTAGVSTSAARSDHQHAHGNLAGGTLHAVADTSTAGFMSAADKTKLDGVAANATALSLASTTPAAVGTAGVGVGTTAARADHVHAHGNQAGGTLHAVADTGTAGFLSAVDKTALDRLVAASFMLLFTEPTALDAGAGDSQYLFISTYGYNFTDQDSQARRVPWPPGTRLAFLEATPSYAVGFSEDFEVSIVGLVYNFTGSLYAVSLADIDSAATAKLTFASGDTATKRWTGTLAPTISAAAITHVCIKVKRTSVSTFPGAIRLALGYKP